MCGDAVPPDPSAEPATPREHLYARSLVWTEPGGPRHRCLRAVALGSRGRGWFPLSSPSPAAAGRGRPNWAGPERTHQKTHSHTGRGHFGSSASVATRHATLSSTRHYPKVVTPSMRTLCGEEGSFVRRRSILDQQESDGIHRDAR